ncbi:hypothetical protein [Sphingomonas sp. PR090111-T3T-6A]|uniref:hypothetical protein n=1 Tax=Sphingomonas sp. PR090111-T3T-6A TaxID=685778 RepID=UPI0012FB786E|nr:hypothetical protein [Sphingomonas sp. PR090111-T3T-6A]
MEADLGSAISETQWGSGDHRLLCALATAIQRHHGHHLNAWMNTSQLVFRGKTPREALRFDDPRNWRLLRRALTAEADRLRNEEIEALFGG